MVRNFTFSNRFGSFFAPPALCQQYQGTLLFYLDFQPNFEMRDSRADDWERMSCWIGFARNKANFYNLISFSLAFSYSKMWFHFCFEESTLVFRWANPLKICCFFPRSKIAPSGTALAANNFFPKIWGNIRIQCFWMSGFRAAVICA